MLNRSLFLQMIILLIMGHPDFAQVRRGATSKAVQIRLLDHPQLIRQISRIERIARNPSISFQGTQGIGSTQGAPDSIPVVVHIVLQNPDWVTDHQVQSQIDGLNRDYSASNPDTSLVPEVWKNLIGNMHLKFCLAKRTPDGDPSNGILRVATTISQFSINNACSEVKHSGTGGSDSWDNHRYLNIWVCNLSGNYLGVTTPPGLWPDDEDGVVIQYTAFGTTPNLNPPFNEGRSCTHEIGHFFSLLHIFGDNGTNGNPSCATDDSIADTPPQSQPTYGCPAFPLLDICSAVYPGVMFMNYMDYSNDSCMHLFTQGQVQRMNNILFGLRASLLSSDGSIPVILKNIDATPYQIFWPVGKICDAQLQPVFILKNKGLDTLTSVNIGYQVDSGSILYYSWSGELPSLGKVKIILPSVSVNEGVHQFTLFTSLPNGVADQQPSNDTLRSSFHEDPQGQIPFEEGFESSGFPPAGWQILNPDHSLTWQKTQSAAFLGNSSVVIRNFIYTQNGQTDDLELPVFDLQGQDSAFLFFDLAAAVQSDPNGSNRYWDTLEVLVSTDCGNTFHTLYQHWGRNLITRSKADSIEFVPLPKEWRRDSVDLTSWIHQGPIEIFFRNITNNENDIYLDQIQMLGKAINPNLERESVLVVPNPTSGQVTIDFLNNPTDLSEVDVYNITGQLLESFSPAAIQNNRLAINLANASNGVYFVRVLFTDQAPVIKKIVKLK
ncbi:MAG: M43 family zinc metalloprotease [Chitinophagaceae bacterium]